MLVNLSGSSITDEKFCNSIVTALEKDAVDASRIVFEISEASIIENYEKARLFIARVRTLGCQFALADFGSGLSALSYLKQMTVDYLKINGSLVKNMANDPVDHDMVKAIHQISHCIGASTIAEFVEDEKTLEQLCAMGIDYAQGYGMRTPSPLHELASELKPAKNQRKAS